MTGEPAGPSLLPAGVLIDAAFSPDGQTLATASSSGSDPAARDRVMFVEAGGNETTLAPRERRRSPHA